MWNYILHIDLIYSGLISGNQEYSGLISGNQEYSGLIYGNQESPFIKVLIAPSRMLIAPSINRIL